MILQNHHRYSLSRLWYSNLRRCVCVLEKTTKSSTLFLTAEITSPAELRTVLHHGGSWNNDVAFEPQSGPDQMVDLPIKYLSAPGNYPTSVWLFCRSLQNWFLEVHFFFLRGAPVNPIMCVRLVTHNCRWHQWIRPNSSFKTSLSPIEMMLDSSCLQKPSGGASNKMTLAVLHTWTPDNVRKAGFGHPKFAVHTWRRQRETFRGQTCSQQQWEVIYRTFRRPGGTWLEHAVNLQEIFLLNSHLGTLRHFMGNLLRGLARKVLEKNICALTYKPLRKSSGKLQRMSKLFENVSDVYVPADKLFRSFFFFWKLALHKECSARLPLSILRNTQPQPLIVLPS